MSDVQNDKAHEMKHDTIACQYNHLYVRRKQPNKTRQTIRQPNQPTITSDQPIQNQNTFVISTIGILDLIELQYILPRREGLYVILGGRNQFTFVWII
jgi:hypothetical protein